MNTKNVIVTLVLAFAVVVPVLNLIFPSNKHQTSNSAHLAINKAKAEYCVNHRNNCSGGFVSTKSENGNVNVFRITNGGLHNDITTFDVDNLIYSKDEILDQYEISLPNDSDWSPTAVQYARQFVTPQ